MMLERKAVSIRFGGSGGQGAVLAATILGEAAVASGLNAAGSSSYGSQARGGAATADLIVSRDPIDYPHISRPDLLVALGQEAYDESSGRVVPGGVIIYDRFFVKPARLEGIVQHQAPATEMVLEKLKSRMGANVFMAGIVAALTGLPDEAVARSIESNLDPGLRDNAKKAYLLGIEFGSGIKPNGGR